METDASFPRDINAEDRYVLERAQAWRKASPAFEPTSESLCEIARRDGIDMATAVFYDFVRTSPENQSLIYAIESDSYQCTKPVHAGDPMAEAKRNVATRVLVVPGAFHEEYPQTGARGERILDSASMLGWQVDRLDVPSLAPMAHNAQALLDDLSRHSGTRTILVSLSKGSADVKAAMSMPETANAMDDVVAWVNMSGMVYGSPLVAWLRSRPLRYWPVRLMMWWRGQSFAVMDELRHDTKMGSPKFVPPQVRAIHVLGFPLQRHLSNNWARRGHARLASQGPNDGGGILLSDILRLPGRIYPVWGADHYMRPECDFGDMITRILIEAAGY